MVNLGLHTVEWWCGDRAHFQHKKGLIHARFPRLTNIWVIWNWCFDRYPASDVLKLDHESLTNNGVFFHHFLPTQEASSLFNLLSYARRYWRRSLTRAHVSQVTWKDQIGWPRVSPPKWLGAIYVIPWFGVKIPYQIDKLTYIISKSWVLIEIHPLVICLTWSSPRSWIVALSCTIFADLELARSKCSQFCGPFSKHLMQFFGHAYLGSIHWMRWAPCSRLSWSLMNGKPGPPVRGQQRRNLGTRRQKFGRFPMERSPVVGAPMNKRLTCYQLTYFKFLPLMGTCA